MERDLRIKDQIGRRRRRRVMERVEMLHNIITCRCEGGAVIATNTSIIIFKILFNNRF